VSLRASDRSTPQSIARFVRDDLLDGVIGPGQRLIEEELAQRFGTGRHSVRAALQILSTEGLVEHRRNRGIIVPEVTAERIDDMCAYRLVLELGALRLAQARGADFAAVEAAVDGLDALAADAPWREIAEAHSAVHRAIVAECGSMHLRDAHAACELELNGMLAIVRSDFTAHDLAARHRRLVDDLRRGGEVALHALEDDLESGGRAAMHVALDRSRATGS
jgi:DNA-binding GntR family transcriptional regulator